ncbi:septum formation initiator family protein [Streptomyces sp. MST-110588]|uniref:FtsB family cell division protein n=1 Tax=Streptomyces sp. MST-110588 TaxID=2833628 RepID=UPI001F5C36AC|nr:septum formation initiator family protein [Streptomyces sp. MST-110588]UNO42579.1 septum formation initiator family protein [Streptomyces sp. MST-110588]
MSGPGRTRGGAGRLTGLLHSGRGTAARTPFVLLVVVLLGSGLITLLLLNSSLNQGSFELSRLEKKTNELTDERQALQQEVDAYSAPGALEERARRLGMVPGGNPAFLEPDGTVRGKPSRVVFGQPSPGGPAGTEGGLLKALGRVPVPAGPLPVRVPVPVPPEAGPEGTT